MAHIKSMKELKKEIRFLDSQVQKAVVDGSILEVTVELHERMVRFYARFQDSQVH